MRSGFRFLFRHSITAPLYQRLPAVKSFRVSSFRVRFDPADSQQRTESVFGEPLLAGLRAKRSENVPNFCFAQRFVKPHKEIGRTEISVILRNLVLEDQMIAKCVPGQLAY